MRTTKRKHEEDDHQAALFQWAAIHPWHGSKLSRYMFAIPNGGQRSKPEAKRLQRQGVKAGVSDIMLMVPRGDHHGLFLELKVGKNKPTEAQRNFMFDASTMGYATTVAWGWPDARDKILDYLHIR